jgi:hypothetical protein
MFDYCYEEELRARTSPERWVNMEAISRLA